ncbi:hypothetical protein V1509DRAFT_632523 [Lipomyces kononenkoae]
MEGKIGYWKMLKESGLEVILKDINAMFADEQFLYIYGDPAYSAGYGVMGPFPRHIPLSLPKRPSST